MLSVRAYKLSKVLASRDVEGTEQSSSTTYTATLAGGRATPSPHPNSQLHFTKSWVFGFSFCIKKKITDTISKTQMSLVEGRAENTWVPPEGQHQGLHGPPTSPTLEQLGVHGPGSYTDPRLPSSHLGARWESELSPPINKCSPNPVTGTQAQLGLGETTSAAFSSLNQTDEQSVSAGWEQQSSKLG